MKNVLTILIAFFMPSFLALPLLRLLKHKIGKGARIGFSIINVENIEIGNNVKIGHFNLISIPKMSINDYAKIGYLNILKGPIALYLSERAAIGNKNYITRGRIGVSYGTSVLRLGELTKITTGHHLDLTQSIIFGNFSILAGIRSQMWTHGYYHADEGSDRIRIDGGVTIGNNVYIGSGCIFNPGVKIADAIHIGAGSVISKDLVDKGMYVGQGLRFIDNSIDIIKSKLTKVENFDLIEPVYTKERDE